MKPGFKEQNIAIYVHWPFCESKCPYCDFNSHVWERVDFSRWQKAYRVELERIREQTSNRTVCSIFFGGGTPSLMPADIVGDIVGYIVNQWKVSDSLEVTLEANPSSANLKKFRELSAAGVNRLSLGIQSFKEETLKFLGRNHTLVEGVLAAEAAVEVFDRHSIDLIYAWPGQTVKDWLEELNMARTLVGSHLSAYQLTIEPGTEFYKQRVRPADEVESEKLFLTTQEVLETMDLGAYEVSNHCKPGHECLHNLSVWRGQDYIGIGPGAHSRLTYKSDEGKSETLAIQEVRSPNSWLIAVETDGCGTQKTRKLSSYERSEEIIMVGLRLNEGVNADRFYELTGENLFRQFEDQTLEMLIMGGFLVKSSFGLCASKKGIRCLNSVIGKLLG